jgi:hypothetical protein
VDIQKVAVNISTPANGASVTSPAEVDAAGTSANAITGWEIYVDSIAWFGQNAGGAVNAALGMNRGTHNILVRAWDSTSAFGDETIKVTVP